MSTPLSISSLSDYENIKNKHNNNDNDENNQLSIEDSIFDELTETNTSPQQPEKQPNTKYDANKIITLNKEEEEKKEKKDYNANDVITLEGGSKKHKKQKKHKKRKNKNITYVKLPKKVFDVDDILYSPPLEYSDM